MYRIVLSADAAKVYQKANRALSKKITRCFEQLEQNPRSHSNIKALKGDYSGCYRYRLGDYRVIYSIEDDIVQVFVLSIAHRGEAYKG